MSNPADIDGDDVCVKGVDSGGASNLIRSVANGSEFDLGVVASIPSTSPGSPTITKKLRFDIDTVSQSLTTSYVQQFIFSGSGKFYGFAFDYDSEETATQLKIDGDIVLDMDNEFLQTVQNSGWVQSGIGIPAGLFFDASDKKTIFNLKWPIIYETSVEILSKGLVTGKNLERHVVILTKET